MSRNIYRVKPDGDRWRLEKNGKLVSEHNKKEVAVEKGRKLGNADPGLAQLVIQKQNGRIQTEHTYGKDPRHRPG